jgi:hypothetical protein
MSQAISKTGVVRLDPDVLPVITKICSDERRSLSNAANLLLIEALIARGLWASAQTTDS